MGKRNWYEISNKAGETPVLYIYDEIGYWGVSAADMIAALQRVDAPRITVRIHSLGGIVSEGVAIFNALRKHPAAIDIEIDSIAASIASVITMAGDTITMASNALLMIHNPWGYVDGDAEELRKAADVMDKFKDTIVTTYAERTGIDTAKVEQLMDDETWFTAKEALDEGFITTIDANLEADESTTLSNKIVNSFRHAPEAFKRLLNAPKKQVSDDSDHRDQGKGDVMKLKDMYAQIKTETGVDVPGLVEQNQENENALATANKSLETLNTLVGERSHDEIKAALAAADTHREGVVDSIVASQRALKQVGDDDEAVAAAKASFEGIHLAQLEAIAKPLAAAVKATPQFNNEAQGADQEDGNPYYDNKNK